MYHLLKEAILAMHISALQLKNFLDQKFSSVDRIEHIGNGWWSQAFSFATDQGHFVIRISKHLTDFQKDIFAYHHFNTPSIPIPEIITTGAYDPELFYCISEYKQGIPSDSLIREQGLQRDAALAGEIIRPLLAIHQLDTHALNGWGYTDSKGQGLFQSWEAYLLSIHNAKYPVSWETLARDTWLDRSLFIRLIAKMQACFPYLPADKHVLHGDYGYDNLLLSSERKIAAVLDWAEMLLGDPMYDLIHMNEPWVEYPEINYMIIWKNEMEHKGQSIAHFDQRLQCYIIHYTLFHLHIHTVRGEEEAYTTIAQWARENL